MSIRRHRAGGAALLVAAALASMHCSDAVEPGGTEAVGSPVVTPTLNTFINSLLQIDQTGSNLDPADADLFTADDPTDCTGPVCKPPVSNTCNGFTDWNEIGIANHQILDTNGTNHNDPSSFPGSNECVGTSVVVAKMDLTYAGIASNNQYVYTATLRSKNEGDAGYYWLFTRTAPRLLSATDGTCQYTCSSTKGEKRLVYDISAPSGDTADVLFAGHFKQNGAPLLRVFRSKASRSCVSAVAALDFNDKTLWCEAGVDQGCGTAGLAAVAVNSTLTDPGSFGKAGVDSLETATAQCAGSTPGKVLGTNLFAEAAVPLSVFTSGSTCNAMYFGSIISRASGSGGTTPDLKDLIGPAIFNFGNVSASGSMTGKCDGTLHFSASLSGGTGTAKCTWTFKSGSDVIGTSSVCEGDFDTGGKTGTITGSVTVTDDGGTGCQDAETDLSTTVYKAPSVNITPSADSLACSGNPAALSSDAITYTAHPSDGTGSYSYEWYVDGSVVSSCTGATCDVDPADSTMCADHSIKVKITDTGAASCGTKESETETYSKRTTVTSSNN
jgi:hypothetical protein